MGVLKCTHTISVTALLATAWSFPTGGSGLQSGQRGIMVGRGHAGDMPKLQIPPSGSLEVELVDRAITIDSVTPNSVFHPDGTAVVIHSSKDDYRTDPAGNAGNRIARWCDQRRPDNGRPDAGAIARRELGSAPADGLMEG